ncbi:efflux RND transporter periplasmic adaptor subunit [Chitinophaga sp. CB10]|uniref:efflux RND transporter periplasmic adaptor subunit n=1 Tax=Chitinophaga sp. CB10 TaxID=1891659 RepID=UPI0025BC10FD|nr:efflux RND transporter periplasmic adaptor subunit [Chitinophaga sp. CB10]
MKMHASYKYFLSSALALGLLISCKTKPVAEAGEEAHEEHEDQVELTGEQARTVGITLGAPEMREISSTIKVAGLLDVPPQQQVSIAVPMGGFVKQTSLLQGMPVKKGQVIAVLENLEYIQLQQDYLETLSQLEYAKVEYERQQELAKENVNALKTLQQTKASWQTLSVKASGLKEKLRMLNINTAGLNQGNIKSTINIYAPISGYVTQVNVNLGQHVTPADVLFRIVDTEHLHAELTVFEKDIPKLKIGQHVLFTLANESRTRKATVHLIGREISEDRTIRVHCHLDQEDTELLPGTYLQALIETGAGKVKAVPESAIVNFDNKDYVFVQTGVEGKDSLQLFKLVPVEKGDTELGYTAITLPADTPENALVIKGAYDLLAKMKNSGEHEGH